MSYVESTLREGEKVIHTARRIKVGWWMFSIMLFLALLCVYIEGPWSFITGLFAALFFFAWLSAIFDYRGSEMAVTNKRLICKKGKIIVKTKELRLDSIESYEQGGATLKVTGRGNQSIEFDNLCDPQEFKAAIETAVEQGGLA